MNLSIRWEVVIALLLLFVIIEKSTAIFVYLGGKFDGLFNGSKNSNLITVLIYDSSDMVALRAGITKRCPRTRHK